MACSPLLRLRHEPAQACDLTLANAVSHLKLSVKPNSSGFHTGHAAHPTMVQASESQVEVDIEPVVPIMAQGYTHASTYDMKDSESMLAIASNVMEGGNLSSLSGDLSDRHRIAMSNCERLFQACLVLAARLHAPDKSADLAARVDVPDWSSESTFVACLCIANAMSLAETGSSARLVALQSARRKAVIDALRTTAAEMLKRGTSAMPFAELCMLVGSTSPPNK